MAAFIAPIISGISSLFGMSAADKAAKAQAAAEGKVIDLTNSTIPSANAGIAAGVTGANDKLAGTYQQDQALLQPYEATGTGALAALNGLAGNGGFKAPTADQAAQSPGEQFMLQQGELAQQRSAAAAGGVLGGGEAKALQNYSQGVASTGYQNAYNNALQGYQTNFGNLSALANMGLSATNTGVGASNLTGTAAANNTMQGAALQSGNQLTGLGIDANALTGAANARASGYVGSANALTSGLGQIGTDANQYAAQQQSNGQLAQLLAAIRSQGGGAAPAAPSPYVNPGYAGQGQFG